MPLSIANFFRNIHFLSHFHYFWQSDRFVKFRVNTDFLINQQKNIFTQHTSHPSLISRENLRSLWHKFLETSTFYHIFAIFHLVFAIFYINTDLNVNSKILIFLHKRRYISLSFRKRIGVFRCKNFSKHPFFTTFSLFLIISNISNKYWLPNRPTKEVFLQKTTYTSYSFGKRSHALCRRSF